MRHTRGTMTYLYDVKIDLSAIVDKIATEIGHMDDGYCWEVDGDDLIISAKHTVGFDRWRCSATLESPAEDEFEYHGHVKDDVDPEQATLNALHGLTKIKAEIRCE